MPGPQASAKLVDVSLADWQATMDVNLTGTFLTFREAGATCRGGRLIAIASTAALKGGSNIAPYAAAKHGVLGLVRSLALEVAKSGITCNALCPGFRRYRDGGCRRPPRSWTGFERRRATRRISMITSGNPHGALIAPEEVAAAALCSCGPGQARSTGTRCRSRGGGVMRDTDLPTRRLRTWLRLLRLTRGHREPPARIPAPEPRHHPAPLRRDGGAAPGEGPVKMSELSRQLLVSNGNATAVVERLEKEGLAARVAGDR